MVTTSKTKIIDDLFNTNIYSCKIMLCKLVSILFYDIGFYDIGTVFCSIIDVFKFLLYNSIFHHQVN